ncbi:hypothetical protein CJU90_4964 [Yarrowia sp. C11]|nr:hypothetical protein CJU90_4964 [Yarrowia sp. C11]
MIAIILLVLTCDIGDGVDRRTTIGHCLAVALSHQTVTLALGLLSKSQHLGDMTTIISAAANIVSIGVAMLMLNVGGGIFRQIWP